MRVWRSLLPLIAAGLIALVFSAFVSLRFLPEAVSQEDDFTSEVEESLPPGEDAPSAMPEDPNLRMQPQPMILDPDGVSEMPVQQLPQIPNGGGDPASLLPPFDPGGYFPDVASKRNPFQPSAEVRNMRVTEAKVEIPLEPLQRYDLSEIKILGILWDIKEPRAMVADPSGKVHIIKQEQKLGRKNGVLALIREGELVVVESTDPGDGKLEYETRVLAIGR